MSGVAVLEVVVSTHAGGGPQHVLALVEGLRVRGWRPTVAGPPGGLLVDRFVAAGADFVPARVDRLRPGGLVALLRAARARRIGLVHSHGKGAGVHGRVVARLLRVPAVHTFHGIHHERYSRAAAAAYLALERRLSQWSAAIVNVSHAQEAEGLALGLFAPRQSTVIVNGVDAGRLVAEAEDRATARKTLRLPADGPVVGCAARFDEVKRLDLLLRAAALVPETGLVVALIGAGREEPALRALAESLGLGRRVVFAGEIPDAARLFRAFDVYGAPSRKEGLPLGLLEAMALGLPVAASDIPAHREVLGPLDDQLVADVPEALAAWLSRIVREPGHAQALGAANRTRARSEFDARQMIDSVERLYRRVLAL